MAIILLVGIAASFAWLLHSAHKAEEVAETTQAFLERMVLKDALQACARAESSAPFNYQGARDKAVIGLRSIMLPPGRRYAYFRLYADGLVCDYEPLSRRAEVGLSDDAFIEMFGEPER
jgi:hypothetical protein